MSILKDTIRHIEPALLPIPVLLRKLCQRPTRPHQCAPPLRSQIPNHQPRGGNHRLLMPRRSLSPASPLIKRIQITKTPRTSDVMPSATNSWNYPRSCQTRKDRIDPST